jgi:hypothetical protein
MKIVGILKNYIIIEPQYAGDCETYIQLTDAGMKELRYMFNVKEYISMEDFHADYFYGITEEEYIAKIKASTPVEPKPLGNIEAKFMEDYINDMYEQQDDLPF